MFLNAGAELAVQPLVGSSPGNSLASIDEFLLHAQRPEAIPEDEV